jgi:hypothetical protein
MLMPTKHRRIAIIRDEEVDQALTRARGVMDARLADASLARELVLRGAESIADEHGSEEDDDRRWLVEKFGARPARRPLAEALAEIEPIPMDPNDPYRATRILQELREERLP